MGQSLGKGKHLVESAFETVVESNRQFCSRQPLPAPRAPKGNATNLTGPAGTSGTPPLRICASGRSRFLHESSPRWGAGASRRDVIQVYGAFGRVQNVARRPGRLVGNRNLRLRRVLAIVEDDMLRAALAELRGDSLCVFAFHQGCLE